MSIDGTHIFISPHPDDVIWSCGGRIAVMANEGLDVAIITVFDGNSELPINQDKWRNIALPHRRRLENNKALGMIKVKHFSLGFTDAALRVNSSGKASYQNIEELTNKIDESDYGLSEKVALSLQKLMLPGASIHVPICFGGHVDHLIVRNAAERISQNIFYYMDFSYKYEEYLVKEMDQHFYPVDFNLWIKTALIYRSQILFLFGSNSALLTCLKKQAIPVNKPDTLQYAEKYWSKRI